MTAPSYRLSTCKQQSIALSANTPEPLIEPTKIDLPSEPPPSCQTMIADLASEARVAAPIENVGPKVLRTAKTRARPRTPITRKKVSRTRFAPRGGERTPTTTVMIPEPLIEPTKIDLPSEPRSSCQTTIADLASEARLAAPTPLRAWRRVLERLLHMNLHNLAGIWKPSHATRPATIPSHPGRRRAGCLWKSLDLHSDEEQRLSHRQALVTRYEQ